jgi:hypothetical protein
VITKVYLMFGADIAQSDTDYNTYTLQRRDSAGDNPATMVSATTKATGGLAFNDNKAVSLGNVFYAQLTAATPQISLSKTHTNAGQAEADGVLVIEYVTY